jgi:O-antigen/teichoic acid export membrane protein
MSANLNQMTNRIYNSQHSSFDRAYFNNILSLGQEFFLISAGQIIAILGGIVSVRVLTGILNPTIYGQLALGMTLATLVLQVVGPLGGSFLRLFSPALEAGRLKTFLKAGWLVLSWVAIFVMCLTILLFLGLLLLGYGHWMGLVAAAIAFSILSVYNYALDSIQNAARQRAIVAWHQGLGQWLRFLVAVIMISVIGPSSSVAMLGYALGSGIVLGSQFIFFRRKIWIKVLAQSNDGGSDTKTWVRKIWSYAGPFMIWGPFTWAHLASDRWALQLFRSTNDVGLYAVLYQVGYYPLTFLSSIMMNFISPILFSLAGGGSNPMRLNRARRLNQLLIFISILLTALCTLLAFTIHRQVFSLLVAYQYRAISYLLPWMLMSGGLFATGQAASLMLLTELDSRALVMPKVLTAIMGILLNVLGAYLFGLTGVVFATVIFSLIYFLWIIFLARKGYRQTV